MKTIFLILALSLSSVSNIYANTYKVAYCAMSRYDGAKGSYGGYGNPMGHAAGYFTGLQYDPISHRVKVTKKDSDFLGLSVDGYLTKAPFILTNDRKLFWGSKKDLERRRTFTLQKAQEITSDEKTRSIFENEKMRIQGRDLNYTITTTFGTDHHIRLGRGKTYCYEIKINEKILNKMAESINSKLEKDSFQYHALGNNCASVLSHIWGEAGLVHLRREMKHIFDLPWTYSMPANELDRVKNSLVFDFKEKSRELNEHYEPSPELYDLVVKDRYLPWIGEGRFKEYKMLVSGEKNEVFKENLTLIKWRSFFPRLIWAALHYPFPERWLNRSESKEVKKSLDAYRNEEQNKKRDLAIKSFLAWKSRELLSMKKNQLSNRSRKFWRTVQELLSEEGVK